MAPKLKHFSLCEMKRIFDIIIATLALLTFLLPMLIVAVLIKVKLGGPVLFSQLRPGLNARPSLLVKFRTMSKATGEDGQPLPDENRLGRFGRFLRASSIDELPEFWNVLRGEMSLVGPRPLLIDYLPLYTPEQARRHEVRPGITGWAQVNGRNTLSWEDRFELDVWYVDNQSLWLDLKIVWLTASKVLAREGISAQGQATMSRFTGSGRDH